MELLHTVWGNRPMVRVEGAYAAVSLGKWSFTILLSLYAYAEAGPAAVGVATTVRMMPALLAAPSAALLADRRSPRALLVAGPAGQAALTLLAALAVMSGASLSVVLALAAAQTVLGLAQVPAQAVVLLRLARTPTDLAAVNACQTGIDWGGFLVGSLGAGLLVGAFGIGTALAITGAAFMVAALVAAGLPGRELGSQPTGTADEPPTRASELLEGLRAVRAHPDLRLVTAIGGLSIVAQSLMDVLLVVCAIELLNTGGSGVGFLSAVWGVGGVLGGIAALGLVGRGGLRWALTAGLVLAGLPFVVIGLVQRLWLAVPLLVVLGVGSALVESGVHTLTQRLAPTHVIGRVFGVQQTMYAAATVVGGLLASGMVATIGAEGAVTAAGFLLPMTAVASGRRLGKMSGLRPISPEAFALLRDVSIFAVLPVVQIETLAARAQMQTFEPGSIVTAEGDHGDAFFVIAQGIVAVRVGGDERRRQGPNESFGEIALLHDVPRTATVQALTPVRLLRLERAEFLAGVGSHERSHDAAGRVAAARMAAS